MKMTRQEKIIWSLLAGTLVILFLLSSTDLIIKEKKTEIYPVSIIIGNTTDDYYTNFRKGVDTAADEYHVDVNFITLYEKGDAAEQMELLKREIDDGAKAVILVPLKPEECGSILEEMEPDSPVIVMGDMFREDRVKSGISQDYREAGRILGEAIARENTPDKPVLLFTEGLEYGYSGEVYDGLYGVLSQAGFKMRLCEESGGGTESISAEKSETFFRRILEDSGNLGGGKKDSGKRGDKETVIAALDVRSLDSAADLLTDSPAYEQYVSGLYGVGSTTKILNQMDRGVIKGLVVSNQFDAGYLSVVKAVEAIKKNGDRERIVLESYYIEKDDLRETRFEKILYPIE